METLISALPSVGADEGDVFTSVRPDDLVALLLHVGDERLSAICVFQRLVDSVDQIHLPTVLPEASLVLAGLHPLFLRLPLWLLQNTQVMGGADFIVGLTVLEQIIRTLVELPARLTANAVYHQMVVEVVGVQVCRHHHLEVRELTLGQLQPDGVGLLRCEIICLSEGLHEVVELSAVGFLESLFCRHHLRVDGLRNAVVAGDKSESAGAGLLFLLDVFQYAAQHTSCLLLVFDRRERRHQSTSVRRLTCSQSTA